MEKKKYTPTHAYELHILHDMLDEEELRVMCVAKGKVVTDVGMLTDGDIIGLLSMAANICGKLYEALRSRYPEETFKEFCKANSLYYKPQFNQK